MRGLMLAAGWPPAPPDGPPWGWPAPADEDAGGRSPADVDRPTPAGGRKPPQRLPLLLLLLLVPLLPKPPPDDEDGLRRIRPPPLLLPPLLGLLLPPPLPLLLAPAACAICRSSSCCCIKISVILWVESKEGQGVSRNVRPPRRVSIKIKFSSRTYLWCATATALVLGDVAPECVPLLAPLPPPPLPPPYAARRSNPKGSECWRVRYGLGDGRAPMPAAWCAPLLDGLDTTTPRLLAVGLQAALAPEP